jgi:energy-coupling factor transporter ATP-binding protein EcfA2
VNSQIYTAKQVAELDVPPTPYFVEDLVPRDGITLLHGPPGVGKSTLLWTMAEDMARGRMFLGEFKTKRAMSLYVNIDMPITGVTTRWKDGKYTPRSPCFYNMPVAFNITKLKEVDPQEWQKLHDFAKRFKIVMIDSLSRITMGMSMKDDWVPIITYEAIKELFPTQAVVLIHHSRKQQVNPQTHQPMSPSREDALGSQFWMAGAQSEIQFYMKPNNLGYLRLVKSQVFGRSIDDGVDCFVNEKGCRVETWDETDNQNKLNQLAQAEQVLAKLNPGYPAPKLKKTKRYDMIGQVIGISRRTVQDWIKRVGYKWM